MKFSKIPLIAYVAIAAVLQFAMLNQFEAGRRQVFIVVLITLIATYLYRQLFAKSIKGASLYLHLTIQILVSGVIAGGSLLILEKIQSPQASIFSTANAIAIFLFTVLVSGGWLVGLAWSFGEWLKRYSSNYFAAK
jgi:hypothetical protein